MRYANVKDGKRGRSRSTTTPAKVGRPARFNREQILQAALALADKDGIEAVTMANVAARVGAQAMSLYRHVRNKEEIFDGLVDLVYSEIEPPARSSDWKTALRQRAIAMRAALLRHPWAVGLMESRRQPGSANLRHHDAVLAALDAAGFRGRNAVRVYSILNSYVYGFALQELSLPFASRDEHSAVTGDILRQFAAADFPHLARVGVDLQREGFVYGDEFEFGLDLILDGVERMRLSLTKR